MKDGRCWIEIEKDWKIFVILQFLSSLVCLNMRTKSDSGNSLMRCAGVAQSSQLDDNYPHSDIMLTTDYWLPTIRLEYSHCDPANVPSYLTLLFHAPQDLAIDHYLTKRRTAWVATICWSTVLESQLHCHCEFQHHPSVLTSRRLEGIWN